MSTGFSNIRTSEYTIINDLYNKIHNKCSFFYPFYFYKKRDDTNISMLNEISNLHIIACFVRRPKTDYLLSSHTYVTFRRPIFEQVEILKKYNIPVTASTPLGSGIENIGFGSKCQWFKLHNDINRDIIEYEFVKYKINNQTLVNNIELLDDINLQFLLTSAPVYCWTEIIHLLQNWYQDYFVEYQRVHSINLFNSIPVQRPVFFVYKFK